jgi:gas vesicle protein
MSRMDFVKGMTIGAVAGATIGMAVMPRRKTVKSMTGKALKAVGEIVENISDAVGR